MSKAIAYILNPEKTDEKLLVSSYGCASETAAREFEWTRRIAEQKGMNPVRIIARHVIQSFEIGEVTPELAHEIGKQFADEILGGKYEYVLTTHIDKDHVHNHLIFNAVDFVDYHAYKSYKRIYYDMREVSDRLCKENGLSVIPPSQNKGMGYKEYTEAKRGTSWKQKLKQTIDRLVITAKDYDDFLQLMQEAGYEIKTGKYISFRAEGQERFTRSKTIGENYTEERIKERIAGRTPRRSQRQLREWKGVKIIEAEVCPDHTYAGRESAEASGGKFHGMPERKEQHNAIRTVWRSEVQIPKQRGLVEGVLCRHGRQKHKADTGVHTKSAERR